jgi:predicted aspartyl protease
MGRTTVTATIVNLQDLWEVKKGTRKPEEVRKLEVSDALADTGARLLSLPKRMVDQLDLEYLETKTATTTAGVKSFDIYGLVQLTIMGRTCPLDVTAIADECPVLIGRIPLERLDYVVDPVNRQLIGNPLRGGEFMLEMY